MGTLSIIIPVYNEEATINHVLHSLVDTILIDNVKKEIIIIDDCSTDNTASLIRTFISGHPQEEIRYIEKTKNEGKGAALQSGITVATGDWVMVQDADLEYDPNEINLLLAPMLKDVADVVYGSRFMGGNPHRILFFWHTVGNRFLTFLSNILTNLNLSDMETCYKMWKREIIQSVKLKEKRFGFEPEVTAKVAKIPGIRIYEVGISYYGRTYQEGKKINWKDGLRAMYCIIRYNIFN